MKLNELKHDHSLTELLKILIFSLLMLAPLFASVSQMLYATFNKNAYQSYSGFNIETNTELVTEIESGLNYQFTTNSSYSGNVSTNAPIKIENLEINVSNSTYNTWWANNQNNVYYIGFAGNYTPARFLFYDNNMQQINYWNTNVNYYVSFTSNNDISLSNNDLIYRVYQQQVGNTLDNAFYYGVEQMTKSDLFNWTQNTALYTGIYGMTSNLEIQTPAIAILLTYWTILTIIYVIIDIVLKGFTYMTHFLQMKV